MKINQYFDLREFVPPEIWGRYGEKSIWFVDPKVFAIASAYREFFGVPVIVNTWHNGGQLTYRGYRPPDTKIGATFSQHRFGRAFDCHFVGLTVQEAYKRICDNFAPFAAVGLTTLEDVAHTPTWLHSDCRAVADNSKPLIVRP